MPEDSTQAPCLGVARIAAALPDVERHRHGIAVFPGADHFLFTDDPRPGIARRDQFAAGFLPMLAAFLTQGWTTDWRYERTIGYLGDAT